MNTIYMDHSATTPVRPKVAEAMAPYMTEHFANPSSVHTPGQRTRRAVEDARETIGRLLGASPEEIIFTSGGTESNTLALLGVTAASDEERRHLVTSSVEHSAVLATCAALEKEGFAITRLPVDEHGRVDPADLRAALRPETALVSIMTANNEVGTIQPIAELAEVAREASVPFHTDAVQAVGKIPLDVGQLGVDLLTVSAHKFYGPKGVGALYVRAGTDVEPVQHGGHHEKGLRAGTENVPGIVGMARALELACADLEAEAERLRGLRDRLEDELRAAVPDVRLNGHPRHRLPHLLNLSFSNVEGESMLLSLDAVGVCVSTGSACTSGTLDPSHVLVAMGIPPEVAHGSLRFSMGRQNTAEDVEFVIEQLPPIVERLRSMSPLDET